MLAPRENIAASLPHDLVDPFNPAKANADGLKSDRPAGGTDREILEKIASSITPSGMMVFDGKPLLLFREKMLRVGDHLKMNLDGADYVVVITAIEATSFRLSLNREEITRPIKPGKTP